MIQLLGSQDGREAEAAASLHDIILASWPRVAKDADAAVFLIAGAKCHGQRRRDIDIVLLATFAEPICFTPFLDISWGSGPPFRPKEAFVDSLCVTIEVKEQDPSGVKFTGGGRVDVRYVRDGQETWSSATDQSEEQKYSLKNYLEHNGLASPYISNLIWLRNVLNNQLPHRPHNLLGGNSTWELFLSVLFQLDRTRTAAHEWHLSARRGYISGSFRAVVDLLTRPLRPTGLDRVRMDRVTHAALRDEWVEAVGRQQFVLRGRGGCGKTMLLLQLAWRLYEMLGRRVLLLTYNRALAADIRRMLTLLGVPDDVGERYIQIQTVYAFFFALLKALGVVSEDEDDFLGYYEERKAEALALLRSGTLTESDLAGLRPAHPQRFGWDYVFIDEAQDWPEDERDLLRFLYSPEQFAIADGMDQLVRGAHCDWNAGLAGTSKTVFLPTCLRMKVGLATFCNAVAAQLGLVSWKVGMHADAPGGRIVIVEGDYFADPALHREIVAAAVAAGNQPVDLLGCVPPQLVVRDEGGRPVGSLPGERLRSWGGEVWDGVVADTRTGYPLSPAEFRVVQYDSSRGLEGWSVFLWGLDDFFAYKLDEGQGGAAATSGGDLERRAFLFAARWLMIPLSRAIDTLVIQLGSGPSPLKSALRAVADTCQDFVEWRAGNPA